MSWASGHEPGEFERGSSSRLVTRRRFSCVWKFPSEIRLRSSNIQPGDERLGATRKTSSFFSDKETGNVWTVYVKVLSSESVIVSLQLTSMYARQRHAFFEFRLELHGVVLSTAAGSHVFYNWQLPTPSVRLQFPANRSVVNALQHMTHDDRLQLSFTIESEEVKETRECTPKEHEHLMKMCEGLLALRKSRTFTDVVVKVEGKQIPAHRNILASSSQYFADMLMPNFKEGERENVVEITDFRAGTIEKLIDFMYTARLPDCTMEEAYELLMASDKYELDELKSSCADLFGRKLNPATAVETLRCADLCNANDLKKKTVRFICEHVRDFEGKEEFEMLMSARPKLLEEILTLRAELKTSSNK